MSYNPDLPPHPLDPATIDPAFAALSEREKRDAWWKGTGDPEAERAGDDVNYAYDDMFIEGLNSRNRTDQQWAEVAYYLATGATLTDVSHYFGMARSTIWRAIQRSPGLRRRIVAEREMLRRETDSRFVALRHAVVEGLYQAVNAGNIRAILWAANRLEPGGPLLRGEEAPVEKEFQPIRRPIPRPARIARGQRKAALSDTIPAPTQGHGPAADAGLPVRPDHGARGRRDGGPDGPTPDPGGNRVPVIFLPIARQGRGQGSGWCWRRCRTRAPCPAPWGGALPAADTNRRPCRNGRRSHRTAPLSPGRRETPDARSPALFADTPPAGAGG